MSKRMELRIYDKEKEEYLSSAEIDDLDMVITHKGGIAIYGIRTTGLTSWATIFDAPDKYTLHYCIINDYSDCSLSEEQVRLLCPDVVFSDH